MDLSPSDYIGIFTCIIATCALLITFLQSRALLKHNYTSVRPLLGTFQTQNKANNKLKIEYELNNMGFGPAIIKDISILYNDHIIAKNNATAFTNFIDSTFPQATKETGFLVPNSFIRPDENLTLLKLIMPINDPAIETISNLNIVIKYQSLYKEKIFTYDSREDRKYH